MTLVSLLVSGLALLVSCFAAILSWHAYRRAGARVVADLNIREPARTADVHVIMEGHVGLSISNRGLAPIGINHAIWLIEMSEETIVAALGLDGAFAPVNGPELPMTLSGLHSAHWAFDFDKLVDRVKTGHGRAHVVFSLGDREVSTPRRHLPGRDSVTVQG